ncbi:TIGR03067 domain-containing protein [Thermogemmata fonticola]|jgi:uncharacterized protein (TIGR03067 family)|uniref:TIGR03067 domain-containing protein n=1 Tax=Thermogemmata fonticola TaxID=2755323 RepID=A0A7V8VFF1_9BACT|nr:TIGR03067 domain-containing protein [Thermogemmata fonticola]MBA2226976.1 TIGR03067 domain-containing protein [Thermogemmata fonticola]
MAAGRGIAASAGWILMSLAAVGTDPARSQVPPLPSGDAQAILGIWEVTALEISGRPESDKNYRWTTFVFTADKLVLREGFNPPVEFTYVLDPSATPKTIDLTVRGHTARGIYKLEGDELVLCLSMGGPRPTSFSTRGRNDTEMFTLRRSLWERYTEPNLGFTVEAPGQWRVKADQLELPSGPVPMLWYQASTGKDRLTFTLVVVTLRGRPGGGKALEGLFDTAQRLLCEQFGEGAREEEAKIKGPWPAREVTLRRTEEKESAVLRARFFLIGERLYVLAVQGSEEQVRTAAPRFWATFRPAPLETKKAEPKKGEPKKAEPKQGKPKPGEPKPEEPKKEPPSKKP